jgi:hypothetical protein
VPSSKQQLPLSRQGFGWQTEPGPSHAPSMEQPQEITTQQAPSALQQAPTQGSASQVRSTLQKPELQEDWVVTMQDSAYRQQAPKTPQGAGLQLKWLIQWPVHAFSAVTVQASSAAQQAPMGVQGSGEQVEPDIQMAPHCDSRVMVQCTPLSSQHAPMLHGFGLQPISLTNHPRLSRGHLLRDRTMQLPWRQHAP